MVGESDTFSEYGVSLMAGSAGIGPEETLIGETLATEMGEFGENARIAQFIKEHCPPPVEPFLETILEIGTGLLPPALGAGEVNVRRCAPILATRLAGPGPVGWSSHRFGASADRVVLHALSPGEPTGAVSFDAATGIVCVDVAVLPCDSRFRLYALAQGELFRSTSETCEVFAVSRVEPLTEAALAPSVLVRHGLLAEGWSAAVSAGWDDAPLSGLLLVLFPAMSELITEALAEVDLADPQHAFLCKFLAEARPNVLDSLHQSLIDKYGL
jgi:hypothetical protein